MTNVFNAGKKPLDATSNSHRLLLIFFAVNTLMFLAHMVSQNAKHMFRLRKSARPAASKLDRLMGRRAGLHLASIDGPPSRLIEISDIQVGNWLVAGDIC